MAVTKALSRSVSKDTEKITLSSSRTNSLRSEGTPAKGQSSAPKLKQKLIAASLVKQEDSTRLPSPNPVSDSKDPKKPQALLNGLFKHDLKNPKPSKDAKTPSETSLKSLKPLTMPKTNSIEAIKKPISKGPTLSMEYEDSDDDSDKRKDKNKKGIKRTLSSSSSKSTPTKVTTKKIGDQKKQMNGSFESDHDVSHIDLTGLDCDEDVEFQYPLRNIADLNDISKASSINTSLINGSTISVDTVYSSLNMDEEADKSDEFRFKRSKRSHYKLQDSILGLISKYQSDLEHLDEKIKTLESQFFSNPPETTGLIKGWEGNVLNNAYTNLSAGLKSRRALNAKFKANFTQTQNLITEHIFSLTSSTCAVSKMLLNN